jgi:nitrogen regulatory protein PII
MKGASMKLVMICYNEAIDDEVIELLNQAGVKGYTKWTKVQGKGKTSGPHLITAIWPKANNVVVAALSEGLAAEILDQIRRMKKQIGSVGLKAFMWSLDEIT